MLPLKREQMPHSPLKIISHLIPANMSLKQRDRRAVEANMFLIKNKRVLLLR